MGKDAFSKAAAIFQDNHTPKIVGEYYQKHLSKNGKYKTHKSTTTLQYLPEGIA